MAHPCRTIAYLVAYGLPILLGGVLPAWGVAGLVPVGPEFQINTYTTGPQAGPSVAMNADGSFVVVWRSFGSYGTDYGYSPSGGSSFSIQGRRYDGAGNPLASEFQVNTYTTDAQGGASVAVEDNGDFVVVWQSYGSSGSDTSDSSIQGQRYDSAGSPQGGEFQVNTYTPDEQDSPAVAVDADGDFVVVWTSYGSSGSDTSIWSVQGQRYDSAGGPVGNEFQVNSYTTGLQFGPSVAMGADGDFVVSWTSYGSSGSDSVSASVHAQRYDSAGAALGGEFQVNTYTLFEQRLPSVALEADGDFVVVWQSAGSFGSDSSFASVQGQRYDSAANPVGNEFQINTYTTQDQGTPSVAMEADGDFLVLWQSSGSSGDDSIFESIQAQRFSSAGSTVGSEFQVNSYTFGEQRYASVAEVGGDFVVVWQSFASSGSDYSFESIQGQRFAGIEIDVKPGSRRNVIKPWKRRPIRVALLGSQSFDVEEVDPGTLAFGVAGNEQAQEVHDLSDPRLFARHLKDVNRDSIVDLVLHVRPVETLLTPGDALACLAGETEDGRFFEGCDTVETRAPRH